MIAFETTIAIERPIDKVFDYLADPRNFPSWNSAVQAVRTTSPRSSGLGSTYSMERRLPTGCATNELETIVHEQPHLFAIQTTSGPTPFLYRYRLATNRSATVVKLDAQVELDGVAAFVPQLARRAVKKGVDDNLATLKTLLEKRHSAA